MKSYTSCAPGKFPGSITTFADINDNCSCLALANL